MVPLEKFQHPKQGRTLANIVFDKLSLEDEIKANNMGELTEELDRLWNHTEIELKEKLDDYGDALTMLAAEKHKLEFLKDDYTKRLNKAIARTNTATKTMKQRLNYYSNGSSLRGRRFTFNPYTSINKTIEDVSLLAPNETYLTIKIRKDYWDSLLTDSKQGKIEYRISKTEGKVSELSVDHPAVLKKMEPSVRVS